MIGEDERGALIPEAIDHESYKNLALSVFCQSLVNLDSREFRRPARAFLLRFDQTFGRTVCSRISPWNSWDVPSPSAARRVQHYAQEAVDAEPRVPEAGVGVAHYRTSVRDRIGVVSVSPSIRLPG